MFSPRAWCYRHLKQLRLALVLCLVVTYGSLLLISIPILAYFDQMRGSENPSSKLEESTVDGVGLSSANLRFHKKIIVNNSSLSKETLTLPSTLRSILGSTTTSSGHNTTNKDTSVDENSLKRTLTKGPWNLPVLPILLTTWENRKMVMCNNHLVLYAKEFARLNPVLIDRRFCVARAKGGEEITDVLRQDEFAEYYNMMRHCFQMDCGTSDSIRYRFNGNNFLTTWLGFMKTFDVKIDEQTVKETGFTIAFMRREYANLYHTVNDWYNLFLTMVFFRRQPEETNILLVDAHPKGNLDPAWPVLFNSTRMLSAIPQRTIFSDMVWGMQGYNSVLKRYYHSNITPPLLEEFRQFALDRFQLNSTRTLNCSNISVLFIWRRDYLAHPRNPSGEVQRKIANEVEMLTELQRLHPLYTIKGVQIDKFSMRDQLKLVSDADVLVGMHGAGLSHTLFVQPHGGTIELVPNYYGADNPHFRNLARWRGLATLSWVNSDTRNELKSFRTIVPVQVIDDLLTKVVGQICSESQKTRLEKRKLENNTRIFYRSAVNKRAAVKFNQDRVRVQPPKKHNFNQH